MRRSLAGLLILLFLATLTGCVRYRTVSTIDDAGTVSGSVIIGYNQQLIAAGKQMNGPKSDPVAELRQFLDTNAAGLTQGTATVTPNAADGFTGFETKFTGVSLADYLKLLRHEAPESAEAPDVIFKLDRAGTQYLFSAELEPAKPGQMKLPPEAFKDADITLSLTFPGPVTSTNGSVSGNTVTWHPDLAKPERLQATGQAALPSSAPVPAPGQGEQVPAANETAQETGGEGGGMTTALIVGAVVLLAAVGLLVFLRRRAS